MNSSKVADPQTLARQSRTFLTDLANLQDDLALDHADGAVRRFNSRYSELFATTGAAELAHFWAVNADQEDYEPGRSDAELVRKYWLLPLRDTLREVWVAEDVRTKRWGLFKILQDFFSYNDPRFNQSPIRIVSGYYAPRSLEPPTKFEEYLLYLVDVSLTRKCENPDCPSPYFFANRRSQKYCADVCAKPAQMTYKREWWRKRGKRWRAERLKESEIAARASRRKANNR